MKLLASIFGLTWANIRNRLVMQIGEKAMAAVEKGVEIFQVIREQGVAGLWDKLVEKIGDIKAMIMEQLEDFVITRIITAGITWLISLLNPAAAFIKACKLIYDVVMFFVNNAARIAQFVNTVIDGVVDIAKGNVSAVVEKVENALGQMVPILIGFIASVLGIGGIGEKIRSIIQAIQKPVNKALDFLIKTGLKLAGPIIRGIKGIGAKVKAKVAAGKAWVKGKVARPRQVRWAARAARPETRRPSHEPREHRQHGAEGVGATLGLGAQLLPGSSRSIGSPSIEWFRALTEHSAGRAVGSAEAVERRYRNRPADATNAAGNASWDAMIDLIKHDPSLISPSRALTGSTTRRTSADVARHRAQTGRWIPERANPGSPPLWHLESEHVVPQAYRDSFSNNRRPLAASWAL